MSKVTNTDVGTNTHDHQTQQRKDEHIRINLEEDVQFPSVTTGLEKYYFMHQAVPEVDLKDVDTTLTLFGKTLKAPLLISSMTGGTEMASRLNQILAEAAQVHNIAMGLGSQRAGIERPESAYSFQVRNVAPDILLFANLGAIQFNYGYDIKQCRKAIEMAEADALILHFNVLQEAVQPEGDTQWSGLLSKVEAVCREIEVPVIGKEVGWGFSQEAAQQLVDAGVSAIDVAGAGGTSWSQVEYHRAPTAFHAQVALAFADWGIPTSDSIQMVHHVAPDLPVFASGGLRDGIDVAKCIALGASLGGFAGKFLKAADKSPEVLDEVIRVVEAQLKIAMMSAGAKDIEALQSTPLHKRS